ncbi:MAG: hypothetical protein ACLPQY_14220 [Streptosporangiaceae bacterium]
MSRDQEATSDSVPVGTRTGTWPADATTTGPDGTNVTDATNGGAFADRDVARTRRDVANADQAVTSPVPGVSSTTDASPVTGASPVTDPAVDTDPTRATVPDLGDPDLDAVPDAPASQSAGQSAGQSVGVGGPGADTTRLDQPATGAHAAPPAGTPGSAAGADAAFAAAGAALVTDADGYRASWVRIQSGFVDDPRGSVTEAADLITQITNTLLSAVQERERTLRGAWDGSGHADTENLRNALRDYRSFFERLIGA